MMNQDNFKVTEIACNSKDFDLIRKDLQDYEFYQQSLNNHRLCTKHKEKDSFRIRCRCPINTRLWLRFAECLKSFYRFLQGWFPDLLPVYHQGTAQLAKP